MERPIRQLPAAGGGGHRDRCGTNGRQSAWRAAQPPGPQRARALLAPASEGKQPRRIRREERAAARPPAVPALKRGAGSLILTGLGGRKESDLSLVEEIMRERITELLSRIDSVSRALENEKKENFSSLRSLDLPCASPRPYGILRFQITHKVQAFVHQTEKQILCTLISSDKCLDLQTQKKVKKKVTHLEVFEASRDGRKHPSSRDVLKAVICIQRYVRGWLEHREFKRVKIKSTGHGPSLPAVVRYYHKMIDRIKCRAGVLDLSTALRYFELEEWMDKKKFYETVFSKREFGKKMDRNDLPEFLRDCGYSIPASGIQCVFQLIGPASTAAVRSIKRHQAIEMTFALFPPLGAKVNLITVLLPWVHPFMDGKDGSKKSAFSHQKSKKADFQVSAALATSSMREGKDKHLSDQDFWCHSTKSSW
ncbi:LOW QUALITY PROTEIN: IQ domain-containing protein M [Phoenicopterus ruber ruber]